MSTNFWHTLPTPFFALAPMADVTDPAFRRIIAKYGKPDVMWTEFVSADGLYHTRELQKVPDAENPLMKDLVYGEEERPIVAQVFTSKPEMMEYVAGLIVDLGFDGLDINMGCPDRSIEKQQAGAALMRTPALARELIRSAKRGTQGKIPVSVKTRVGFNKLEHVPPFGTWLAEVLAEEPDALTVHARTRKEMSKVPARWEHVREAVELRDRLGSTTRIIGNGDLKDLIDARAKVAETGADGAMLGRAIFGNPWLFAEHKDPKGIYVASTREEKLRVLVEHCYAFDELCNHKSFAVMKKHFKAYVRDFDGAGDLREKLYATEHADGVAHVVRTMVDEQ
jgi:nifR3 family TIM-barrel protein